MPRSLAKGVLGLAAMSVFTFKLLASVAIVAVAVLGGLIPLLTSRRAGRQRFFSLGNAFAGGLFLGVGFMHLLPEGFELLAAFEYPLAALLAASGFGVLLLLDRVVFSDLDVVEASSRSVYPYLLLALLSMHSVVAGVALGLEPHVLASLVVLLGILCHKGSAAFALMVSAHAGGMPIGQQKAVLATFAAMTPLGVLAGTFAAGLLAKDGHDTALIEGGFNALAAGTFIYMAILHIIDAELASRESRVARFVASSIAGDDDVPMPLKDDDRTVKFALVVAGIAVMALLATTHTH